MAVNSNNVDVVFRIQSQNSKESCSFPSMSEASKELWNKMPAPPPDRFLPWETLEEIAMTRKISNADRI